MNSRRHLRAGDWNGDVEPSADAIRLLRDWTRFAFQAWTDKGAVPPDGPAPVGRVQAETEEHRPRGRVLSAECGVRPPHFCESAEMAAKASQTDVIPTIGAREPHRPRTPWRPACPPSPRRPPRFVTFRSWA
jgi:hypothetical protein